MIIIIINVALIVSLAWKIVDNFLTEKYSPNYCSSSIEESKKSNKFVKEVIPISREVRVDNFVIKIKECWLEERTQIFHDFIFFKRIKKISSYYLCFTLENNFPPNKQGRSYQFWREGSKYGFAESGGTVYLDELTSLDYSQKGIKVDVIEKQPSVIKGKKVAEINFPF